MLIKNEVFFHSNGYNVANGASCMDLPIAIAVGSIFKEDYYKYLFSLSFKTNWEKNKCTWYEERGEILSNMNYIFVKQTCGSWKEALAFIHQIIAAKGYVLMPVTYNALYYYLGPKSHMNHMILISGYDRELDILLINDCNFVNHGLNIINKEYTVYQVAMHTKSIEHVWNDSLAIMEPDLGEYCLYALQEAGTEHLDANSYTQKFFSAKLAPNNSLNLYNQYKNAIENAYKIPKDLANDFIFDIRRSYIGWLHPFFDYFNLQERKDIKENINKYANNLYEIRNSQITKVHIRMLRKSEITREYIIALIKESGSIENEIHHYLKAVYLSK